MSAFMEDEEEALYRSLREYSRVDAFLPVKIRELSMEELKTARSRMVVESVLTEHPELPDVEDEQLSACLHILNAKLDSIIRSLAFPADSHKEMDFKMVNISAGGLSLKSGEDFETDRPVEVRVMLPTAPLIIFYIYGHVVKCESSCEKYKVCIEFSDIDDDIREEIAKYVFHRQREVLRKKRYQRS